MMTVYPYYGNVIVCQTDVVGFVHVTSSWQERDSHARHGMHTEGVSYFSNFGCGGTSQFSQPRCYKTTCPNAAS